MSAAVPPASGLVVGLAGLAIFGGLWLADALARAARIDARLRERLADRARYDAELAAPPATPRPRGAR